MNHQDNSSTQHSPTKSSLLYFEPQIIKSMLILEINTQTQGLYTYQLGLICSDNSILFSSQINEEKIHKYYTFRQIWIKVYYACFQLNRQKHLLEIKCLSNDISHVDLLQDLTMLYFEETILLKPSKNLFLDQETNVCLGFIFRIVRDQKSNLLLKICSFYGRPQQEASKYPSGLIYIRLKGKYFFYGFCQVKKKGHLQYDRLFRKPRMVQCSCELSVASESTYIVNDDLEMKRVDNLMEFPYNSIGLLSSPPDASGNSHCGTASVLLNSDKVTSKFLITCAHNFIDFSSELNADDIPKMQYKGYKLALARKASDITENYIQFLQQCGQLSIKTVHMPPQLIKPLANRYNRNVNPQYEYEFINGRKDNIQLYQMYDIAIVELMENIKVFKGFRLKQTAKIVQLIIQDKIEIAGFPASLTRQGEIKVQFGRMYHQSVGDHQKQKRQKCFKISKIQDLTKGQSHKFIQHKLSTLSGNSGSPIFEKISPSQVYLLGVHTKGLGADSIRKNYQIDIHNDKVLGTHNRGVYIYNQNVFKWIKSIKGIQQVIDKTN